MAEIYDVLQCRPQQVLLAIVPWLCHPASPTLMTRHPMPRFAQNGSQIAEKPRPNPPFLAKSITLPGAIGPACSTTYMLFTDDSSSQSMNFSG
jgi:hypothetical protein